MNLEAFFAEAVGIKSYGEPVDGNTAAITGARIGLQKGDRAVLLLNVGDSTAAVLNLSLKQHTLVSGGSSKALSVANPYYKKVGAATKFTKVSPAQSAGEDVAFSSIDLSTDFAAEPGLIAVEVLSEQLDNENGYGFFSVDIDDTTAAKIIAGIYILSNVRLQPAYSTDL